MNIPIVEFADANSKAFWDGLLADERARYLAEMQAEDEDLARQGYDTSGAHVLFSVKLQRIKKLWMKSGGSGDCPLH